MFLSIETNMDPGIALRRRILDLKNQSHQCLYKEALISICLLKGINPHPWLVVNSGATNGAKANLCAKRASSLADPAFNQVAAKRQRFSKASTKRYLADFAGCCYEVAAKRCRVEKDLQVPERQEERGSDMCRVGGRKRTPARENSLNGHMDRRDEKKGGGVVVHKGASIGGGRRRVGAEEKKKKSDVPALAALPLLGRSRITLPKARQCQILGGEKKTGKRKTVESKEQPQATRITRARCKLQAEVEEPMNVAASVLPSPVIVPLSQAGGTCQSSPVKAVSSQTCGKEKLQVEVEEPMNVAASVLPSPVSVALSQAGGTCRLSPIKAVSSQTCGKEKWQVEVEEPMNVAASVLPSSVIAASSQAGGKEELQAEVEELRAEKRDESSLCHLKSGVFQGRVGVFDSDLTSFCQVEVGMRKREISCDAFTNSAVEVSNQFSLQSDEVFTGGDISHLVTGNKSPSLGADCQLEVANDGFAIKTQGLTEAYHRFSSTRNVVDSSSHDNLSTSSRLGTLHDKEMSQGFKMGKADITAGKDPEMSQEFKMGKAEIIAGKGLECKQMNMEATEFECRKCTPSNEVAAKRCRVEKDLQVPERQEERGSDMCRVGGRKRTPARENSLNGHMDRRDEKKGGGVVVHKGASIGGGRRRVGAEEKKEKSDVPALAALPLLGRSRITLPKARQCQILDGEKKTGKRKTVESKEQPQATRIITRARCKLQAEVEELMNVAASVLPSPVIVPLSQAGGTCQSSPVKAVSSQTCGKEKLQVEVEEPMNVAASVLPSPVSVALSQAGGTCRLSPIKAVSSQTCGKEKWQVEVEEPMNVAASVLPSSVIAASSQAGGKEELQAEVEELRAEKRDESSLCHLKSGVSQGKVGVFDSDLTSFCQVEAGMRKREISCDAFTNSAVEVSNQFSLQSDEVFTGGDISYLVTGNKSPSLGADCQLEVANDGFAIKTQGLTEAYHRFSSTRNVVDSSSHDNLSTSSRLGTLHDIEMSQGFKMGKADITAGKDPEMSQEFKMGKAEIIAGKGLECQQMNMEATEFECRKCTPSNEVAAKRCRVEKDLQVPERQEERGSDMCRVGGRKRTPARENSLNGHMDRRDEKKGGGVVIHKGASIGGGRRRVGAEEKKKKSDLPVLAALPLLGRSRITLPKARQCQILGGEKKTGKRKTMESKEQPQATRITHARCKLQVEVEETMNVAASVLPSPVIVALSQPGGTCQSSPVKVVSSQTCRKEELQTEVEELGAEKHDESSLCHPKSGVFQGKVGVFDSDITSLCQVEAGMRKSEISCDASTNTSVEVSNQFGLQSHEVFTGGDISHLATGNKSPSLGADCQLEVANDGFAIKIQGLTEAYHRFSSTRNVVDSSSHDNLSTSSRLGPLHDIEMSQEFKMGKADIIAGKDLEMSQEFKMGNKDSKTNNVRAGSSFVRQISPRISQKPSYTFCNLKSVIPLVQQRQAATSIMTGKRDVKVKTLEAAKDEKRREQKCKMRKELARRGELKNKLVEKSEELNKGEKEDKKSSITNSDINKSISSGMAIKKHVQSLQGTSVICVDLKLRRALEAKTKLEQVNVRKLEEKKQKEEVRKKNAAEVAAAKRKKAEMSKRDREEKQRRLEDAQKQKKELEEQLRAENEAKKQRRRALDDCERMRKAMEEEAKKQHRIEKERDAAERRRHIEENAKSNKFVSKDAKYMREFYQDNQTTLNSQNECAKKVLSMSTSCTKDIHETEEGSLLGSNAFSHLSSASNINPESYEITPYKSSDVEDNDDGKPAKPIPLWARKAYLIPHIIAQQCIDPDEIFTGARTCRLSEVFETDGSNRRDFKRRSYSGEWRDDCFTQEEEYEYRLQMGYREG